MKFCGLVLAYFFSHQNYPKLDVSQNRQEITVLHGHKTRCCGCVTHIGLLLVSPAARGQSLAADGISYNAAISACADGRLLGSTEKLG